MERPKSSPARVIGVFCGSVFAVLVVFGVVAAVSQHRSDQAQEAEAVQAQREQDAQAAVARAHLANALPNFKARAVRAGLWGGFITDAASPPHAAEQLVVQVGDSWFAMRRSAQLEAARRLQNVWQSSTSGESKNVRVVSASGSELAHMGWTGSMVLDDQ